MQKEIREYLNKFDIHNIITILAIAFACIWYTSSRFDKIEKVEWMLKCQLSH